jgi:hypothetical protein
MTKKVIANPKLVFHMKFHHRLQISWCGRIILTLNDDETSIEGLPLLDVSNLDKICILRTVKVPQIQFPYQDEIEDILRDELPHFARWLLDWQPPKELSGSKRFEVASFHDESVLDKANQSSPTTAFEVLVLKLMQIYFKDKPNVKEQQWRGDIWARSELIASVLPSAANQYKGTALNSLLTKIARSSRQLKVRKDGNDWIIERPEGV